jgi:hypothetical protein
MCHYQFTVPVPAVIVVTLKPPDGADVDPVRPAPIVMVLESGYFNTIKPEPPAAAKAVLGESITPPPPPPPVFTVPALAF